MQSKLQIYKRTTDKKYYLRIITGTQNKKAIKIICCNTSNKKDALSILNNHQNLLAQRNKNSSKKISDIRIVVLDYARINLSKGSLEKYEITLRKMIEYIGDKFVDAITMKDIEVFKLALTTKVRKETINSYLRNIKAIWNLLYKLGLKREKDLTIKQFKIPEKEIVSFTDSEMKLILMNIRNDKLKNIVTLAVHTGLRISELLNLKVNNIDFENELIKVNNTDEFKTKSRKNRLIPFNNTIKQVIDYAFSIRSLQRSDNERFLFVSKFNIPYKRNHVTRYFRRILDELNFNKRYHFHCLRATFVMSLVRKGVNPIIIQKLAGHSSLNVTQRYCFIQISDLKIAINQ